MAANFYYDAALDYPNEGFEKITRRMPRAKGSKKEERGFVQTGMAESTQYGKMQTRAGKRR